jgi:hypothetical protein
MALTDVAWEIRKVIKREWQVANPEVEKPLVVAHTGLSGLDCYRHY